MAGYQFQSETAILPTVHDDVAISQVSASTGPFPGGSMRGVTVFRSPQDLHLHPALLELDCLDLALELNEAERIRKYPTAPIPITSRGIILSGFGRWRSALLHEELEIQCVEYPLDENESLQYILADHKPQRGWNAYVRTRLALTQERYLQLRAVTNMREGGRYKGSAKLPNHQHIDVRCEIAELGGVGARNVSNVKIILKAAHPRLLSALRDGELTINKALGLCKLPTAKQLEAFTQQLEERAVDAVIRGALKQRRKPEPCPDAVFILAALQQYETRFPGSVAVRRDRSGRILISVGNDILEQINTQKELQLDETERSTQANTCPNTSLLGPE
jgi:hypothetical protein